MKYFLIAFIVLISSIANAETLYFKAGVGYKIQELQIVDSETGKKLNAKDTANFELGIRDEKLTYGYRHVSNYSEGWPNNNNAEYNKDEFFIEYEFDLLEF